MLVCLLSDISLLKHLTLRELGTLVGSLLHTYSCFSGIQQLNKTGQFIAAWPCCWNIMHLPQHGLNSVCQWQILLMLNGSVHR